MTPSIAVGDAALASDAGGHCRVGLMGAKRDISGGGAMGDCKSGGSVAG
jgi:hypothetical protein